MTTLCLADLSERDFAMLNRMPRKEHRTPERLDTGSIALHLARAILPERLQLSSTALDDCTTRPIRAW